MQIDPKIWFSPARILSYYALRESQGFPGLSRDDIKNIHEAKIAALFLTGMIKHFKKDFWIQLVDSTIEQTPDIRTCCFNDENNDIIVQDVEIVTYESHTQMDLAEFILEKKLNKSYPKETTILCFIDKRIQTDKWSNIKDGLSAAKLKSDTFLMGRVSPHEHIYQLAQLHPVTNIIETVDSLAILKNHKMINTLKLQRGRREDTVRYVKTADKIEPF